MSLTLSYPEGNRFAVTDANSRQAEIWIVSLLSLMYSIIILAGRVVVKWNLHGLDDVVMGVAYCIAVAHWICLYLGLQAGLGKTVAIIGEEALGPIDRYAFAARILLLTTTGLTKCAVALFVRQIVTRENRKAWYSSTAVCAVMAAWTVIVPIVMSVPLSPTQAIEPTTQEYRNTDIVRWRTVSGLDLVLECCLVILPLIVFARVQMSVAKRAMVVAAFAFRILNGLLIILSATSYVFFLEHGRPSIGLATSLIWQELLLAWSLMSATIPVLKGFVGRFATAELVRIGQGSSGVRYATGSQNKTQNGESYAMSSMSRPNRQSRRTGKDDSLRLWPEDHAKGNTSDAFHETTPREDESIASGDSEQMIIHRRTEWEVRSDTRNT